MRGGLQNDEGISRSFVSGTMTDTWQTLIGPREPLAPKASGLDS